MLLCWCFPRFVQLGLRSQKKPTYDSGKCVLEIIFFFTDLYSRAKISQNQLEGLDPPVLKRVFVEFAKHAFGDEIENLVHTHDGYSKPFYDQLYEVINEEIGKLKLPKSNLVSWLKEEDLQKARMESTNIPAISSIKDLFEKDDAEYPKVNLEYFNQLDAASPATGAGPSHSAAKKKV